MNQNPGNHNQIEGWRINMFSIGLVALFLIFVFRLFSLQIIQGPAFQAQALDNRTEELNLATSRGNIYDRNGIILARNIPAYNIIITPAELPDDIGEIQEIYRQLSALTGLAISEGQINDETPYSPCVSDHGISQIVAFGESTNPFRAVQILCDINEQIANVIEERAVDWPGVAIEIESVREYPTGELTAALVGFLGPIPADREQEFLSLGFVPQRDKIGYAGLEFFFQTELGGLNGLRVVERDVAGQILRTVDIPSDPIPGQNLHLTIDTRLQNATDAIVKQELAGWNAFLGRILSTNAVAIAMNPQTGEILAMVTIPTYENNRFARIIPSYYYQQLIADQRLPLFNHAIQAEVPPGSVFKLATAVGALNEGVVSVDQILDAPPAISVPEQFFAADFATTREFVDWNDAGFGQIAFVEGLGWSSNVYFYKLGGGFEDEVPDGLGICRLGAYARALGYGQILDIELPAEASGLIPDPRWKRINRGENWSTGNTYNASVGQGFINATPLQVLMSAATIANNGLMMQPTVIREIIDGAGNIVQAFNPFVRSDLTVDPVVEDYFQYTTGSGQCQSTGNFKSIQPTVIEHVQDGMRMAVTTGTLVEQFEGLDIPAAGKTGTAEYCDNFAQEKNLCIPGNWPTHAWTVAYAPFENPEIVVVAFVYNGGEGASVAGPIVRKIMQAYFEIKALDTQNPAP
jgi:penicillin-binding protein 2